VWSDVVADVANRKAASARLPGMRITQYRTRNGSRRRINHIARLLGGSWTSMVVVFQTTRLKIVREVMTTLAI
jgi:hypothetical protein